MRNLFAFYLGDLSHVVFPEVLPLLRRWVIMLPHLPGRAAPVFAVVDHLDRDVAELLILQQDHFSLALGLAARANLDRLRFAGRGLGSLFVAAIVRRDLLEATWALKSLRIDSVSGRRLAAAAVAAGPVEPVDLGSWTSRRNAVEGFPQASGSTGVQ